MLFSSGKICWSRSGFGPNVLVEIPADSIGEPRVGADRDPSAGKSRGKVPGHGFEKSHEHVVPVAVGLVVAGVFLGEDEHRSGND